MGDVNRYPLSWPIGWPRSVMGGKRHGTFRKYGKWLTVSQGLDRLYGELERIGAKGVIVSSNIQLGMRGQPLSGQAEPTDRGVAVYFQLRGKDRVLAWDTFTTVADNMAGVAGHIEAMRTMERYGVGTIDQAFAGYDALPPPGASNRPPWRKVLGLDERMAVSRADIEASYRAEAKRLHPDMPTGSHEAMAQLNEARDAALREIG